MEYRDTFNSVTGLTHKTLGVEMNEIQELEQQVRGLFPGAETKMDEPDEPPHPWWLDIKHSGKHFTVEWRPGTGFGVSLVTAETAYGDGPEHVVHSIDEALECLLVSAAVAA
jgi:hypothetical protein